MKHYMGLMGMMVMLSACGRSYMIADLAQIPPITIEGTVSAMEEDSLTLEDDSGRIEVEVDDLDLDAVYVGDDVRIDGYVEREIDGEVEFEAVQIELLP